MLEPLRLGAEAHHPLARHGALHPAPRRKDFEVAFVVDLDGVAISAVNEPVEIDPLAAA